MMKKVEVEKMEKKIKKYRNISVISMLGALLLTMIETVYPKIIGMGWDILFFSLITITVVCYGLRIRLQSYIPQNKGDEDEE